MKTHLKKSLTLILFFGIIVAFVSYEAGFFEQERSPSSPESREPSPATLASNSVQVKSQKDSLLLLMSSSKTMVKVEDFRAFWDDSLRKLNKDSLLDSDSVIAPQDSLH